MIALLKASCLTLYTLGIAAYAGLLPATLSVLGPVAATLLAAHVLEAALMFRFVKRYPGPLTASLLLTLLYGFLHWWPLRRRPV